MGRLSIDPSMFGEGVEQVVVSDVAETKCCLAVLYKQFEKYDQAKSAWTDALEIYSSLYGAEHARCVAVQNELRGLEKVKI